MKKFISIIFVFMFCFILPTINAKAQELEEQIYAI